MGPFLKIFLAQIFTNGWYFGWFNVERNPIILDDLYSASSAGKSTICEYVRYIHQILVIIFDCNFQKLNEIFCTVSLVVQDLEVRKTT